MNYKSDDIYISPDSKQYRIHYDETCKAYRTEVNDSSGWRPNNTSFYKHFQDACGEFAAVCRINNLIKMEVTPCTTYAQEPEDTASSPAEEAPADIPADATDAIAIHQDAAPVSSAAAFDYSGLDGQTVAILHSAEAMIRNARKNYIVKVADAVAMAHDKLVAQRDKHGNQYVENTFRAWCESVGIGKDTAYRLLQVDNLLASSTPNEQKILEAAPPTLLYAAAKPSAPPELVERVKSGDITTNKQYQDALAAKEATEKELDKLRKEKEEQGKQLEASRGLVKMLKEHQGKVRDVELERDAWKRRAEEAESRPVEVAIDETASEKRAQELAEQYRKEDKETIEQLRQEIKDQKSAEPSAPSSDDAFEVGLNFCDMCRKAWQLTRPYCMSLKGEDRYQMCDNLNKIIRMIKGDMS